jgi:hypothetical protein
MYSDSRVRKLKEGKLRRNLFAFEGRSSQLMAWNTRLMAVRNVLFSSREFIFVFEAEETFLRGKKYRFKSSELTLLDVVDEVFSPLLELLVPFSISQRLPNVGLPRAARAPCSRSLRKLKSGNEKDERLRRIAGLAEFFSFSSDHSTSPLCLSPIVMLASKFSVFVFVFLD